jgi:hypothetical protein
MYKLGLFNPIKKVAKVACEIKSVKEIQSGELLDE